MNYRQSIRLVSVHPDVHREQCENSTQKSPTLLLWCDTVYYLIILLLVPSLVLSFCRMLHDLVTREQGVRCYCQDSRPIKL